MHRNFSNESFTVNRSRNGKHPKHCDQFRIIRNSVSLNNVTDLAEQCKNFTPATDQQPDSGTVGHVTKKSSVNYNHVALNCLIELIYLVFE
jgi:hypothetical protein